MHEGSAALATVVQTRIRQALLKPLIGDGGLEGSKKGRGSADLLLEKLYATEYNFFGHEKRD